MAYIDLKKENRLRDSEVALMGLHKLPAQHLLNT